MAVQQEPWTKPPINCFFFGGGGKESTRYLELGYWIGFLEERGEEDRNAHNQRGSRQCSFQAGLLRDGLDSGAHQVGRGAKINVRL